MAKKQTITTEYVTKQSGIDASKKIIQNLKKLLSEYDKVQKKLDKLAAEAVKRAAKARADEAKVLAETIKAKAKIVAVTKASDRAKVAITKASNRKRIVVLRALKAQIVAVEKATAAKSIAVEKATASKLELEKLKMASKIKMLDKKISADTAAAKIKATAKIVAADKRAAASTERYANRSKTAVQQVILSWKSFERVILVHVIRRAFHMLMTTTRQSVTAIQEFHSAIVEIRTISQTLPGTVNQWADSLERVSNAWGIDLIDAANARYQILSNQIAKGVEQTELFSVAAFKFAKITKSTAEESVNLLTASMNAYGMKAEEVTRASAILFKLIEFGRVRVTDIANSFGRASVPAAQLGISLEELAATIAAITIKGVKGTESMTLIRGIVMKLNKPTTEMNELFAKLGVTSGEALIAMHGLAGTLKILEKETRGSSTAIAELFGRIRPTMGISALLSDLDNFKDVLAEFGEKAVLDYMNAFNDQFKTTGERVKVAFNQVKNFVNIGLGKAASAALLKATDGFKTVTKSIDGTTTELSGLVNVVMMATRTLISLSLVLGSVFAARKIMKIIRTNEALLMFAINMRNAYIAAGTAGAAMAALTALAAPMAILAGIIAAAFAVDRIIQHRKEVAATSQTINDLAQQYRKAALAKVELDNLSAKINPNAKRFRENIGGGLKGLAGSNKLGTGLSAPEVLEIMSSTGSGSEADIEKTLKSIKAEQKVVLDNFKGHASLVANTMKAMYGVLENKIKATTKAIKDASKATKSFIESIDEKIFNLKQLGKTPGQQLEALQKRKKELDKELLNAKGWKEQIKAAEAYGSAIGDVADKELEIVNAKLSADAASRNQQSSQNTRINKLEGGERFSRFNTYNPREKVSPGKGLKEKNVIINASVAEYEALQKRMQDIDDKSVISQNKVIEAARTGIEDLKTLRADILAQAKGFGVDVAKVITDAFKGLDLGDEKDVAKKLVEQLMTGDISELDNLFHDTVDMAGATNQVAVKIADTRKNLEGWVSLIGKYKQEMENIVNLQRLYDGQIAAARGDVAGAEGKRKTAAKNIAQQIGAVLKRPKFSYNVFDSASKTFTISDQDQERLKEYVKVLNNASLPAEDYEKALTGIFDIQAKISAKIVEVEKKGIEGGGFFETWLNIMGGNTGQFKDTIEAFNSISTAAKNFRTAVGEKEKAKGVVASIDAIAGGMGNIKKSADAAGIALAAAAKAGLSNMGLMSKKMAEVVGHLREMHKITGGTSIELNLNKIRSQDEAHGGVIHAAMGQFVPRGTDTTPAMLTPGEFVMNKASTQRFMNQLVPMNYSQNMVRFAEPQNNMQFGDINVTVQGGQNNQQTALEIGNALRREIRRGRLSL